jgi:hypothetical protein
MGRREVITSAEGARLPVHLLIGFLNVKKGEGSLGSGIEAEVG